MRFRASVFRRPRPAGRVGRTSATPAVEALEPRWLLTADVAAPTGFAATAVSPSEIGLAWQSGDPADTAVIVERSDARGGAFAQLAVLSGGSTIYTDSACWAGQTYAYRVRTRGPAGDSPFTVTSTASTPGIPAGAYATARGLTVSPRSPTTAVVSFNDPNTDTASWLLERSSDGISYVVIAALGSGTRFEDTALAPGGSYRYRTRATGWLHPTSDYSPPVTVTMPARAAAAPLEPVAVDATALSASAVRVSWRAVDTQATRYVVERSVDYNPWHPITWQTVATTAPGAESYVDEGLPPETAVVYRVRAFRDGIESAPGIPANDVSRSLFGCGVAAITASAGRGTARTVDIGPGQALTRLGDLDWTALGPGDTVNIHAKPGGYHELLQISSRGAPGAWITVNGVPDPVTGALPLIDARDAVLAPQFGNHYGPVNGSGAIVVGARPGFTQGFKPGYLTIRNLEIANCHASASFRDVDGTTRRYDMVGAGVYLERCDHVSIVGCVIRDNGEGVFGAGQSTFDRLMTDITLESNVIQGNGNVGRDREHNTYIEAIDTTYRHNSYGPLRAGALGAGLKDRSVGTVIEFNRIVGGAHQLQIPEAQNQADLAVTIPRYHATRIVGNVLVTPAGNGASPIWFGGDQGLTPWYRKGVVDVVHNTFVIRSDQSQVWKLDLIRAASPAEAIDARGNVIAVIPDQAGGNAPELGLVGSDNRIALGRNRVPAALRLTTADDGVFRGAATGVEWLIRERAADPGFVSAMTGDYRLGAGSECIDAGPRLPDRLGAAVLASQFRSPVGGSFRSVRGTAPDLGAFEFGAPAGRASTTVAMAPPTGLRVRVVPGSTTVILDWIDRSKDESLFVVERSWTGRTWQVIATAAANTTSFVDTSARPGRTSVYRIRAVDTTADPARWSVPSSAVRVRLP